MCEQVEELSPIREYVFSLSVPESKPLHYEWLNGKAAPVVKTAGGMKTVTWILKNVQPRPYSLDVSLPAGNVQAVVASTYASKADALKVIKQQLESNGKDVTELAQKLTAGAQTTEQKKGVTHCLCRRIRKLPSDPVANRIPFASGFRSDPFGIRN